MLSNKIFKFLMIMLLGITFTSCGSDDKDNPEGPDNQGPYLQKMEVNGRDCMTNIQRDNQGRITQYTEEEDIIKYVYTENAIYAFINGEKWAQAVFPVHLLKLGVGNVKL